MIRKALIAGTAAVALAVGTLGATGTAEARSHYHHQPSVHFGFGYGYAPSYRPYAYAPYAPYSGVSCRHWSRKYHHWVYSCGGSPYPYYPAPAPFFSFGW